MSIFDNFIENNGDIVQGRMIAWIHTKYKNYKINTASVFSEILKQLAINVIMILTKCCTKCITLNSCHFVEYNMPKNPVDGDTGLLHPECHCHIIDAPTKTIRAICTIEKLPSTYLRILKSRTGKLQYLKAWAIILQILSILDWNTKGKQLANILRAIIIMKVLMVLSQPRVSIIIDLPK